MLAATPPRPSTTPTVGREVEIFRPDTDEAWHELRAHDVTASVAGALFDTHPYVSRYSLWAVKAGKVEIDAEENAAMRRGRLLEPVAIQLLQEEQPSWKVEYVPGQRVYYRHASWRIGATPDAKAVDPERPGFGVVQIKTVSELVFRKSWLDPETGTVILPAWIAVQAIVEAQLTGASWAAVAVMVIDHGLTLHVIDIPIHTGVWVRLGELVAEFWRMVDADQEPPIDWSRDGSVVETMLWQSEPARLDMTGHDEFDRLVGEYRAHAEWAARHKTIAAELKPQILHLIGTAESAASAQWEVVARTQYRSDGSTPRVLRIKPKESHNEPF